MHASIVQLHSHEVMLHTQKMHAYIQFRIYITYPDNACTCTVKGWASIVTRACYQSQKCMHIQLRVRWYRIQYIIIQYTAMRPCHIYIVKGVGVQLWGCVAYPEYSCIYTVRVHLYSQEGMLIISKMHAYLQLRMHLNSHEDMLQMEETYS